MKKLFILLAVLSLFQLGGCTRIETGTVGVRIDMDLKVEPQERLEGSWNQTLVGTILEFPIREVKVDVDNMTPTAKDNSTMKDFDLTVIYSIKPDQVAELYSSKNQGFHTKSTVKGHENQTLLMGSYIQTAARNAAYKTARKYDALEMNDARSTMEIELKEFIAKSLAEEKLDGSITISQVLIRSMLPADSVVASANDLVKAKNELTQKNVEVKTAEAEARRMAALANQGSQSIAYMQAQAELNYSEAAKAGKINTIIVPRDFKGIVNMK